MVCVNSVNVYPSKVTLQTGSWYYGAWAEVCPTYAECTDVSWYSDNPSVASVNATSGYIYARSAGSTRIYAYATDGSGASDYITVTVTGKVYVTSVALNRASISLEKGDRFTLTATVCPENATNRALCWRSTNTSVAEVNNGIVTAKASGYAYIYAEATDGSGKYARCYVHVTRDVLVTSVTVEPSSKTMTVGESAYLYAVVCPEDAINRGVEWKSSNNTVATVNPDSGLVIAQNAGSATITATACDGSGEYGECSLTVDPPVAVTGIQVCPTSLTMNVGDTARLCTVIRPENATNQRVTWCSSNENVACVDYYTGEITANLAGTATITATTVDGSYTASCTVTVKELVIIEKDGNYSKVIFNDGKIWKCNAFYYNSVLESNYPVDTQRSIHNSSINFTEKQLGFLFRIDPNGVIYYVKDKRLGDNASPTDYLLYRDNIFRETYGRSPKYFTYENSQVYYWTGVNEGNRYSVYSEAELIFGMLPRWTWQNVIETLLGAAFSIISLYVPALNAAALTIDLVAAFFFTDAFEGAVSAVANEYISECITTEYGEKVARRFGWATTIAGLIQSLFEDALPPDIDEGQISVFENAYKNESYLIKISDSNQTVDLNEFIEHYKSLLSA